ncbi:MAG: hypothetical protein HC915_04485 [Anaerolineae bacterium]|nr:hypothetical protein [Anaerolineae bacterium]
MFFARQAVNIHIEPDPRSTVLGNLPAEADVLVTGAVGHALAEQGYIWHQLQGQDGWVAERNINGDILLLEWRASTPPPVIPLTTLDSRVGLPAQPASFSNKQLLDAVHRAALALEGNLDKVQDWLLRGRLYWLGNHPQDLYWGDAIANLPGLNRDQKTEIISQLARLLGQEPAPVVVIPEPDAPEPQAEPAPPVVVAVEVMRQPAPQPATDLPTLPENVDLDPADYERTRLAALNITRAFEGGGYASYNNYDRGIVSYGIMQFTLAAGSLGTVLRRYWNASESEAARALQGEFASRVEAKDPNLRHDGRFKELLKAAAQEEPMKTAQQTVAREGYWDVVLRNYVQRRGNLRYPLTYALLFDMGIHFGVNHALRAVPKKPGGAF